MQSELALFIVFACILLIDIIALLTVWPYACARGCCKCKYLSLFENPPPLTLLDPLSTVCKKDHSRTDYRKADKMRPGIWYLILASGYLAISLWSLYFVCTMHVAV